VIKRNTKISSNHTLLT